MRIKTIGSGSQGNCYLLTNNAGHSLVIECGIHSREMLRALNYSIMEVDGCIVSHEHGDHAGHIKTYEKYALPVWKAWEEPPSIKVFGDFTIVSFELPHDGTENRGFVIRADDECVVYMTDMEYCRYTFKSMNPTVLMVECNHKIEYLNSDEVKYEHSIRGHCDLETCKELLKANHTASLKQVVLIHPSKDALDKEEALNSIKEVLNENVKICFAENGKTIEI